MKRCLLALFVLFTVQQGFSYDWPAPDMKIRKTFGQRSSDALLPGVEMETGTSGLTAPGKGDLLFLFQPGQRVQNLPSGLGGFVALAHEDNLRTLVTRIVPQNYDSKHVYQQGELLGATMTSPGSNTTKHRLFVFDQQLGELINPLLVYPPLVDTRSPVIFDVKAVPEGGGPPSSLFSRNSFPIGYWSIQIDTADPANLSSGANDKNQDVQRGVYLIQGYLNGAEVFNLTLNSFQEKGGLWYIKGMTKTINDVLTQDKEWNLGQIFFNQGTNIFELVVKDFQGNETGKTFRILGVHQ